LDVAKGGRVLWLDWWIMHQLQVPSVGYIWWRSTKHTLVNPAESTVELPFEWRGNDLTEQDTKI
jgi:hypothetical protein